MPEACSKASITSFSYDQMVNKQYLTDLTEAKKQHPNHARLFQKLRRQKPKKLDATFHDLHDEAFSEVDCLECANCCKTTSPLLSNGDIERLAKTMKMKSADFEQTYVRKDEDGDLVFNSSPCPFLAADHHCLVYQSRPQACREYPHTNRKRMYQILDLTLKNSLICPAVARILQRLQGYYK